MRKHEGAYAPMDGSVSIKHNRDSTKKEYSIDCMEELNIIRTKYNDRDEEGRAIRPKFFSHVAKKKGYYDPDKKNYKFQMAPMDYLQEIVNKKNGKGKKSGIFIELSIGQLLNEQVFHSNARNGYVDLIIAMVRDLCNKTKRLYSIQSDVTISSEERRQLASDYYEKCVSGIRSMNLTAGTMKDLLLEIDKPDNSDIKRKLWTILFGSFGKEFMSLIKMAKQPISTIAACQNEEADVYLYGLPYKYVES